MRIAIASDHGGFDQKDELAAHIRDLGHELIDFGPDSADSVDYPDYAKPVAEAVASGEVDRGVLICGTGIGMSLAANKVAGVRAAPLVREDFVELARAHNNLNVLCLSGRFIESELNKKLIDVFLTTEFDGGRHEVRVNKIMAIQDEQEA